MRIAIIGCGWVGGVTAVTLASLGHDVIGIDVDESRIATLSQGQIPFVEPDLQKFLQEGIAVGRLRFSSDVSSASDATVAFLCVPTPSALDGSADCSYVFAAGEALASYLSAGAVIVIKSTVPPGTTAELRRRVLAVRSDIFIADNPEFLAESTAIRDALQPSRIVLGVDDVDAERVLRDVYASYAERGTPIVVMSSASAELAKYAANAFLATKISFVNEIAALAEVTGAEATDVMRSMGFDERIGGRFLRHGIGYGGGCFPKDVAALSKLGETLRVDLNVIPSAQKTNQRTRERYLEKTLAALGDNPAGKTVAILGLAFKPHTDDLRDAPALFLLERLTVAGVRVRAFDPVVDHGLATRFPTVIFCPTISDAVVGVDVIIIATEWPEIVAWSQSPAAAAYRIINGRPA